MYVYEREQGERKDYNLTLEKLKHLDVQANLPHSFNDNRCLFKKESENDLFLPSMLPLLAACLQRSPNKTPTPTGMLKDD